MKVINWLGIPEKFLNSAILSLTHRSMLNLDNSIDGDKIKQYHNIGKNVYEALLMKFINSNYNLSVTGIFEAMKASKACNIIYNRLRLNELAIVDKNVNEEKVTRDLVFQFFGFLYMEISFEYAYKLFTRAFTKNDVVFFSDYLSVLNGVSGGKDLKFEEISVGGTAHEPWFTYRLKFKGKEITASSTSKKSAKKACAKIYCEENLSEKDIFLALGYNKKTYSGRKKYHILKEHHTKIENIAAKWNFATENIYNALVNKYLYNEYDFDDCNYAITIGSFYELILIEKIVNRLYGAYNIDIQKDIINYLTNNNVVYKTVIKILELNDLFVLKDKVIHSIPLEVLYREAVRQLIYFAFENNNTLFFRAFEEIIAYALKDVNPYLLDPVSKVAEMYGQMKITGPSLIISNNNSSQSKEFFNAKLSVVFDNTTVDYFGEGVSKALATNDAYDKFWKYIHTSINDIFKIKDTELFIWFIKIIGNHTDWFYKYIKNNHHFVYVSYENNDYISLIEYLHIFYCNIENVNDGKLVSLIKTFFEAKYITIKIEDKDVLLSSIWRYISNHSVNEKLTSSIHINSIIKLSEEVWKELLQVDGRLIRHISTPNAEMQMIAVNQNTKAINYIATPTNDVVNEVYNKSTIDDIEIRPQVIDSLIEIKKQEIEKHLRVISFNNLNVFLLEQHCFDLYLRAIINNYNVRKFYIACGFVYSSGIKMLQPEIDVLLKNSAEIKILAGNLQQYFSDNGRLQMDLQTAKELNFLIKKGVQLKTITNCFYHGKMFFLVCDEITFVIVGSTNMSRNAFRYNNEFDNMFVYETTDNEHMKHFQKLWQEAISIDELDETKFSSNVIINEGEQLNTIDANIVRDRISQIEDINLKNRLVTWLKYNPINIYDKIDVAGREYIAIEFSEKQMIVLESFYPGNSYFVFYGLSIHSLIKSIEGKNKTQIFELSGMEKRGYHIREQLNLDIKIKSYFL